MSFMYVRPEITPEMRAAALENPNSWLYVIDPALDPDDEVPPWGVVGAYPVNELGQIEENFHPNSAFRPAPKPALERLLELVKAGEREQRELLPAVLDGRLLLYAAGPEDSSVTGFPDRRHGTVLVPVCTSPAHVPPSWPGWREITGRDLVPLLHGHPLVINPGGPVTAVIPAAHLSDAAVGR
jgi:SseB protein N-terminal domain